MAFVGATGAAGGEAYRFFCAAGDSTTSDRFVEIRGLTVQSSEIRGQRQLLRASTLTTLRVWFNTPYTTANATITVRKNGADTTLTGTISAGAQTLTVTGTVTYSAGDALSVKISLSSAEANATLGISCVVY